MQKIDNFLNSITMYRLVLYGLSLISLLSVWLGFSNIIFYSGEALLKSLIVLVVFSYFTNFLFTKIFSIPSNAESSVITALILFLIMFPASTTDELLKLGLVGALAISSKYIFAPNKKLIFNPAAFGAFAAYIFNIWGASWWVATPALLPLVLIVGFLFVRKIRRFQMFFAFAFSALVSITYFNYSSGMDFIDLFTEVIKSWPLVFFGTVMFTEPITTPPTRKLQLIYGVLVGLLFGSQFTVWKLSPTPEFVLLIGNIFSYAVSLKKKITLSLVAKKEIGENIYEFVFSPDSKFNFNPGQYVELTLGHKSDDRGNRRYFTIASSPTEEKIKFGIRLNTPSSSFKDTLQNLSVGSKVIAGQLAGDFVLSQDPAKEVVFIAGGIGITPFRSMIKYLLDSNQQRSITLLYFAREQSHFVYKEIFSEAQTKLGLKVEYLVSKELTTETIKKHVNEPTTKLFYISGPDLMVNKAKGELQQLGVSTSNIITDYFPGF